jgi:hypothetical protein
MSQNTPNTRKVRRLGLGACKPGKCLVPTTKCWSCGDGCFIGRVFAPGTAEESKAVSPLHSATALHGLALPWTAVGSGAPHRFGCFIGRVSTPGTAEESKAVSPLHSATALHGAGNSVRGAVERIGNCPGPGFDISARVGLRVGISSPTAPALPPHLFRPLGVSLRPLRLCGELFLDLRQLPVQAKGPE